MRVLNVIEVWRNGVKCKSFVITDESKADEVIKEAHAFFVKEAEMYGLDIDDEAEVKAAIERTWVENFEYEYVSLTWGDYKNI